MNQNTCYNYCNRDKFNVSLFLALGLTISDLWKKLRILAVLREVLKGK